MDYEKLIFNDLNESQKEAVRAIEGPVLVVAGPGTGKTLTIVRRIAYLIHRGVCPENILAVTFTNRAAREMKERAEALLGKNSGNMLIGTFHLLGLNILRDNLPDSFVIYNRDEQLNLLKSILKDSGMKVQEVADRISRIKSLIKEADGEMKVIYDRYQSLLLKNGAFDFDDLILKPLVMFGNSVLLDKYRERFRYIIVDEYQDINPAQHKLLRLLAGDDAKICAVGDSDQAIYAFRGADVENFLNFKKDFKDAKTISLTHNYRSTGMILNASNSMIKHNAKRIDKELHPVKEGGTHITVISVPDERSEGELIVDEIEAKIGGTSHYKLMNSKNRKDFQDSSYGFSDFAVVFRTNAQVKAIEETFIASGIPYQVIGGRYTMKRKGMADIILRLKGLADKMDNPAPLKNISIDEFLKMAFEELKVKGNDNSFELLNSFAMLCKNTDTTRTVIDFLNELSLLTPADDFDPRAEAVTLMTLHMAKGLEFMVVFIAGIEDGLIPYTITKESTDIEEERRLFYVGMTRAKEELFFIHARNRLLYGNRLNQSPSPFLNEIPERFMEIKVIPDRPKKSKEDKQLKLF
jgi:DNA helicase-2/ATP-dependent DNA helicase PcrA